MRLPFLLLAALLASACAAPQGDALYTAEMHSKDIDSIPRGIGGIP